MEKKVDRERKVLSGSWMGMKKFEILSETLAPTYLSCATWSEGDVDSIMHVKPFFRVELILILPNFFL